MKAKEYLGDAVYVEADDFGGLWLTTEVGSGVSTNRIYLDPAVYAALAKYADRERPEFPSAAEGEPICGKFDEHGFACTRPRGHRGLHVAHGFGGVEQYRWDPSEVDPDPWKCRVCGEPLADEAKGDPLCPAHAGEPHDARVER